MGSVGSDADMEDYGFEFSDAEPEEQDVDSENQYYSSKVLVETEPEAALEGFAEVVSMEPEKAEWGFKALKQTVKLYYKLGKYKEMMDAYRDMLTYIKSAVTRNYSEKCINNIMDFISGSASQNFSLQQEFYQTTLSALEEAKNERLWFKTNLNLCKIWFEIGEYGQMSKILKELHKSCQEEDGTDDQKKGTQLLEVYAIEIQMYTETKNNKKLKELYKKALTVKSAIPHPRIMGIIRECGGKMHMAERQWAEAAIDFFEAFKNYNEAGNQRRIQCLKYLVLANMLMESEVNPFDGEEAKRYKNDPEILAMTNLIAAYQRNGILEFEKILKSNRRTIMDDPFIRNYIEDLLMNLRTQVLFKLIKPYTSIRNPSISKVNSGRMREDEARKYFQQLIIAVDYCHSRAVIHRDLKLENLLLDAAGNLKVSDFGLSAMSQQVRDDDLLHTACGTPKYVAPEVLNDRGYDGAPADIWSCGVILFVLLTGYLPFDDSNVIKLYKKTSSAQLTCPPWLSLRARKLITRVLDPNPLKRITIPEILADKWFKKGFKPPVFDVKEDTNLDDVEAVFKDSKGYKKETRFTSKCPRDEIINKIEQAAKPRGVGVQKKNYKFYKNLLTSLEDVVLEN